MSFERKTVLISGATLGIGAATANAFVAKGARLMLTGRDAERARKVRAQAEAGGAQAALLEGDLRDASLCDRVVEATVDRFGRLDVLVNGAGVIYRKSADKTTDAEWRETIAVNLDAVFLLSRAAVRRMKPQGGGGGVNVASDVSVVGAPKMAAYCASKGAVLMLTKAMALDHAREGIRVNAVCPDEVETPMLEHEFRQLGLDPQEGRRRSASNIPLGRLTTAEEVADSILFLASEGAGFITGATFMIDGGYTAA